MNVCQVYKGEIEEKNQAASSNSTAGIIRRFLSAVNYFLKIYPTDSNFAKNLPDGYPVTNSFKNPSIRLFKKSYDFIEINF
ncbi:hypothetical protein F7O43_08935 [Neisseria meningitidis]|nr:hypothetical protein [Neisseria meningitidis]MBG8750033.1 hypothetical protein [Neisseria meningitidis]MBG8948501.1 hypothetical protein [Neisseria meningitidis]MBG9000296.1 hypothetical protein [Neisseria meningitidis]MBJ7802195.1 hypothetical protein [Neisseria meningitidis]